MCGIAAIARIDGGHLAAPTDKLLESMANVLAHRGPDDRELHLDGPVGMAFTRLSLTDPAGGGQPLVSDDGSLVLIANGEIYNYKELAATLPAGAELRTGSDCEVLLHLYREHGTGFLDNVRGMFGLVLWDKRENQLILARDRFGIKPLYYSRDKSRIILASEIKALFADPATPRSFDWKAALTTPLLPAAAYLTEDSITTWFQNVQTVPAGTILRIDLQNGSTHGHRYWDFPGQPEYLPASADEFVERYKFLLTESINECATSDAELGLFLSGGIDSAAVAAIAAGLTPELQTFTVLSASTYRSQDAEYAHRIAGKLGLPNHQVVFDTERVPAPDEWKRLLWLAETPFCGPEIYYKYELHRYAKAARPELRGMLLGAASDEFNGGYSVDVAGGGDWDDFDQHIKTMARDGLLRSVPDLAPWWSNAQDSLLNKDVVHKFTATRSDAYQSYIRYQYSKIQQYNVWHEDRSAAGSGIEARVPFLDHRLIELVAAVPPNLRPELLWDKQILRRGLRGILTDDVITRPKQAFFYGVGVQHTYRMILRMLDSHGGALVEEAASAPGADEYIDANGLHRALERLSKAPSEAQVEIALRVVNLGLLAGMVADLPAPTADTPVGAPPPVATVSDWTSDRDELERVVGLRPTIEADSVPRLTDGTLVLTHPNDPAVWYVAMGGSLEYVLDDDAPQYRALLIRVDGERTIGEIADQSGATFDELYPVVAELLELRVIGLVQTGT